MTPKEKAEKMVLMFEQCQSKEIIGINYDTAVRNALICVDEILKICPIDYGFGPGYNYGTTEDYWQEVKQEISKL